MDIESPFETQKAKDFVKARSSEKDGQNDSKDGAGEVVTHKPAVNIATISAGFEKGDFLVREEKGKSETRQK